MTCAETKHLLTDAALGEIADRAVLERHLATCPACRAEFADLELTRKLLLQGLPEEEPPRRIAFAPARPEQRQGWGLRTGVSRRLAGASAGLAGAGGWRWAFAGAMAMALFFAGMAVRRPNVAPSPAPGPSQAGMPAPQEVQKIVDVAVRQAVEEHARRERAETAALVSRATGNLTDQMRYFERTQNIFYKQAEQSRSEMAYVTSLVGRSDLTRRPEGEPVR